VVLEQLTPQRITVQILWATDTTLVSDPVCWHALCASSDNAAQRSIYSPPQHGAASAHPFGPENNSRRNA
jgi:hypothetical protein